jgi:hypothetical protein
LALDHDNARQTVSRPFRALAYTCSNGIEDGIWQ